MKKKKKLLLAGQVRNVLDTYVPRYLSRTWRRELHPLYWRCRYVLAVSTYEYYYVRLVWIFSLVTCCKRCCCRFHPLSSSSSSSSSSRLVQLVGEEASTLETSYVSFRCRRDGNTYSYSHQHHPSRQKFIALFRAQYLYRVVRLQMVNWVSTNILKYPSHCWAFSVLLVVGTYCKGAVHKKDNKILAGCVLLASSAGQ